MVEIALLFLRMGFLGFGGPIAAVAMFEDEFARKRKWISTEHYSEIYTVLKLCPGPLSTQMAIYLGRMRAGNLGGLVAGVCYILPAFVMLLVLSDLYVRSGGVISADRFLGFQLGALVVILQSTLNMARPYKAKWKAWVVAALAFPVVYFFPRYEPLILIGFGILGILLAKKYVNPAPASGPRKSWGIALAGMGAGAWGAKETTLAKLFWMCFKSGAFVFGSGLAIIPLLEGDAVRHYHWLTHQQFMAGLALGQITPGPVVITATFIGYIVAAWPGATLATAGIFFPSFINVFFILPKIWGRVSKSPYTPYFTSFAIPAVIGAIFATTFRLSVVSLISPAAWIIFVVGLSLSQTTKAPGWLLILGSGAVGYFFH